VSEEREKEMGAEVDANENVILEKGEAAEESAETEGAEAEGSEGGEADESAQSDSEEAVAEEVKPESETVKKSVRKKNIIIGAVVAIVAIIGAIAYLTMFMQSPPEKAAKNFLDTMIVADFANVPQYSTYTAETFASIGEEEKTFFKAMFSSASYKITKVDTQGDKSTITLTITAKDGNAIVEKISTDEKAKDATDQKVLTELVNKYMQDASIATVDKEATLEVNKVEGKWLVTENDAILDTLTGGFFTAIISLFMGGATGN
jgi:hypothetical protein